MSTPDPSQRLSSRLAQARPSATGAASEAARRLIAQGRQVISLAEGELDFDTPAHIQRAAIAAIEGGATRYTSVGGTAALKAAIVAKFARDNQLSYQSSEVIAATGAKQILFNALLATVDSGDEVIMAAPYWVSYSEMVRIAGGEPVILATSPEADFKLTPQQLQAAITPQTRWLMLNSPCNPSGALYSADELRALAEVLRPHPQILVLADDIYEAIVFEGRFSTFAEAAPELFSRTLTVNGVSKSHAMTGWRLGYAGGPAWLIRALELLQSQSTSNPSSISQAAALAALEGPQDFLDGWRQRLRTRRDLALSILADATPWLRLRRPAAAFYLYADCHAALGARTPQGQVLQDDWALASWLLQEAGVSVVPGSAFGMPGYLRLAYATDDERLARACRQIVAACQSLRKE
ncbi:pyridoxal phosphate-dependent aminotransferase [Herbaspirillum sp. NPDC087042]|uniref:pyridoxal phosphate-dependent aminotransferase n=1 Tax=Herbaspirillum sp. NPDC087042 TaxID=3364004 RepID=UPI00381EA95D